MILEYDYDVIHYSGKFALWKEKVAGYAVKLNLDTEKPTELATFDEEKVNALRQVFWSMNRIQLHTEVVEEVRSTTFVDEKRMFQWLKSWSKARICVSIFRFSISRCLIHET